MKVIIAGSRHLTLNVLEVCRLVRASGFVVTEVVSGGAEGIDTSGEKWAECWGIPVRRFPVTRQDWLTHGLKAGPLRNEQMARYGDALIVAWDGQTPGTRSMIERAKVHGLRTYLQRLAPARAT